MWPPRKRRRLDLDAKYVITTVVALCALALGVFNTYITSLRQIDDASVVIGELPGIWEDADRSRMVIEPDEKFIFINSGTRTIAIDSVFLEILHPLPPARPSIDSQGCGSIDMTTKLTYDIAPFVVKAGEMIPKSATFAEKTRPSGWDKETYQLAPNGNLTVPFSKPRQPDERRDFKVCMTVQFTTPDADLVDKLVVQYSDYFDKDTLGFIEYREPARPPISLIRARKLVFPWE